MNWVVAFTLFCYHIGVNRYHLMYIFLYNSNKLSISFEFCSILGILYPKIFFCLIPKVFSSSLLDKRVLRASSLFLLGYTRSASRSVPK